MKDLNINDLILWKKAKIPQDGIYYELITLVGINDIYNTLIYTLYNKRASCINHQNCILYTDIFRELTK